MSNREEAPGVQDPEARAQEMTQDSAPAEVAEAPDASGQGPEEELVPTAPSEESKERFREALEAKKAASHRGLDSGGHGPTIRSSEVNSSRRMFRRKSG